MKLLDLKDDQIVINPEVLEIPEFKALWDRDKSKGKANVFKELQYIYYSLDTASPYSDYPEEHKITLICKDVFKQEDYTPDTLVILASNKFVLLSETPTQRLFLVVKEKINSLSEYLKNAPVNEDTVESVLKVIESTSKLIGQLSTLQQAVDKETEDSKQKVRGGKKIGRYED